MRASRQRRDTSIIVGSLKTNAWVTRSIGSRGFTNIRPWLKRLNSLLDSALEEPQPPRFPVYQD